MNNFLRKKERNIDGYTLIEVILVITITGITFVTLYALYASTVRRNVDSRYEVIASNLAQEGVEIVRNIRDQNVMASLPINNNLTTGNCAPYFEANTSNPECDGNRQSFIELTADGIYRNCSPSGCVVPEKTIFKRSCNISGDAEHMVITCTVEWNSFVNSDIVRKADATVTLTDWQE